MVRRVGLPVLFLMIPMLLAGQSFGELANKEKERRKKNREQGVAVRVIDKEEVSEGPIENSSGEMAQESEVWEDVDGGGDSPPSSSSSRLESEGELDQATGAVEQLNKDARRAGIPPGWVR